MSRPQQPELHRSGQVPALDPDATESELEAEERPGNEGDPGPVPEENRPGSSSGPEQDQPDPDDFVARFGGSDRPAGDSGVDAPDGSGPSEVDAARRTRNRNLRSAAIGLGGVVVVLLVRRRRARR